ncbi:GPI inositol-deacylase [Aphelenchoides fujianensis]|nr:GPI inositol-deacylase [Aphelenchoides fujianensis]KAI6233433.1 GPI inositol-deacylase [Aphelenchoides fujianensis]
MPSPKLSAAVGFLAVLVGAFFWVRHAFRQSLGQNDCDMTYMWRQIAYMDVGFRPNGRYSLFLYGEGNYARNFLHTKKVDGLPVIFVPGNAGSGKQVRSLASVLQNKTESRATPFHFDLFAVDFNEEFSALHSSYLLNHTRFLHAAIEHVWRLYAKPPAGIVLFGHSVGGLVSRLVLENAEIERKISLVFSIAAPFKEPPYPVDKRMLEIWRRAHALNSTVPVVSVDGGLRDELIAPEWTRAPFALHSSTAEVDDVWVETDHRSIVWCNQFVRQNTRFLFDYARSVRTFRRDFGSLFAKHFKNANQYANPTVLKETAAFVSSAECNPKCPSKGFLKWDVDFNNRVLVVISGLYRSQLTAPNGTLVGEHHKCGASKLCLRFEEEPNDAVLELKGKDVWVFNDDQKPRLTLDLFDGIFRPKDVALDFEFEGATVVPITHLNRLLIFRVAVQSTEEVESVAFVTPDFRRVATRVGGRKHWELRAFVETGFSDAHLEVFGAKRTKVTVRYELDVAFTLLKLLRTTREHLLAFTVLTFVHLGVSQMADGKGGTSFYALAGGFGYAWAFVYWRTRDVFQSTFVFVFNIVAFCLLNALNTIAGALFERLPFSRWSGRKSTIAVVLWSGLIVGTAFFHSFLPLALAAVGLLLSVSAEPPGRRSFVVQLTELLVFLQFPSGWELGFGLAHYRQLVYAPSPFTIPALLFAAFFPFRSLRKGGRSEGLGFVHRFGLFAVVLALVIAHNPTHFAACLEDLSAICVGLLVSVLI